FVERVQRLEPGNDIRFERPAGLHQHRCLRPLLQRAFPAIDRDHARENVDAGGEPLLHQRTAHLLRLLRFGERGVYEDCFVGPWHAGLLYWRRLGSGPSRRKPAVPTLGSYRWSEKGSSLAGLRLSPASRTKPRKP